MNDKIKKICQTIKDEGGRAVLVGGCVRDTYLNLTPKDIDLEVYLVQPEPLKKILQRFGQVSCVGESFQVYKLTWKDETGRHEVDVSIPRKDVKNGDGHKGFTVTGNPFATFEDASSRRDFTINAIMVDPLTNECIDPFNGVQDIKDKVIRAVDPKHFVEDSLRVLRAMQFAARFGFKVEESTAELCRSIDLTDLPKERVWDEFEKMLLKSNTPWTGVLESVNLRIAHQLFPQLMETLLNPDLLLSSFNPLDETVKLCIGLSKDDKLKVLVACIAAYITNEDDFLGSIGIINAGSKVRDGIIALCTDFDTPFQFAYSEIETHYGYREVEEGDFRRLSQRVNPRLLTICAKMVDEGVGDWFIKKMEEYGVADGPPKPFLQGRDLIELGVPTGPEMGHLIKSVYELQLNGFVKCKEQALDVVQISLKKQKENII